MAGLHAPSVKDFVMIFQVLVRKAHKTKRPSGKIFELKMGLCKALARSYLSGNDAAKAAAIAVFNQKANAQKLNAHLVAQTLCFLVLYIAN